MDERSNLQVRHIGCGLTLLALLLAYRGTTILIKTIGWYALPVTGLIWTIGLVAKQKGKRLAKKKRRGF